MSKSFQYSILRYRPSYLLDERVNIGLAFYFPEEGALIFKYPKRLQRISQFFPNLIKLADIRRYLNAFEKRAIHLSKKKCKKADELDEILSEYFLLKDANSLFFSEAKNGFYNHKENIINYYYEEFFRFYQISPAKNAHTENYLKEAFEESLKKLVEPENVRSHYFKRKIVIDNEVGKTEFDFGWQNGTTNLIKTISFDLNDEHYIQRKAFRWYGELNQLSKKAQSENIRFDLLIARPQKKNLFKAYEKALYALDRIEANHHLLEEPDLKNYLKQAVKVVLDSSH